MLFCLFSPEKHNPQLKQIKAYRYFGMCLDYFPGLRHPFRPVDIIKYKCTVIIDLLKTLIKIIERCFLTMIAINKNKIHCFCFRKNFGKRIIKIAINGFNVFQFELPEIFLCDL